MRFILFTIPLFLLLAFFPLHAQTSRPVALQTLIEEALSNNPQLKSLRNAVKARQAKIPVEGALPDPVLGLSLMNVPSNHFVFNQEAMSGKQIRLMQKIPFPGKLGLKSDIAGKETEIAEAIYEEIKNLLIKNVKTAYYNLVYIDQAIETTHKNQALLKEFVKIATAKYSVGKGLQQDVLKAQVELARLSDRLLKLQQKRETIEARLNRLLNRTTESKIGKTTMPQMQPSPLSKEKLQTRLLKNRPLVIAWQKRLLQSKQKVALAKKNYWPDFNLSLAYTQRDVLASGFGGQDFISIGLSFNLPLFYRSKQSKQVESNVFFEKQTEENFKDVVNQISEALDNALTELEKNIRQESLYRTSIIPQATQSLESARAGYQNDKADFLTLINNQMTLFNIELEYQRILSDYFKSLADVEYIVGQPLEISK